jgi:uncharacterized cofD-like protein
LAALLSGLKRRVGEEIGELTGIVAVSDDGGSSGRLRRDLGLPPPGDIRNCLVALADDEDLLARLFQHRFEAGEGLSGHSFGNLFLAALTEITGDFPRAILTAERILSVRGTILPATTADLALRATTVGGRVVEGESAIGRTGEPIARVELVPASPPAYPPALEAIRAADLVVLGPGSLYTSILPNLLLPGIRAALGESRARTVLVLNLMTQPGETDGLDGPAHLAALAAHAGAALLDAVLVHRGPLAEERLLPYRREGARPVHLDAAAAARAGLERLEADLLAREGLVRHDPDRLAAALVAAARDARERRAAAGRRLATPLLD